MKTNIYMLTLLVTTILPVNAQNTPTSQMEKLDRGVVALPAASGTGNFVSWRLLGTDDEENTTFTLLKNGLAVSSATKINKTYFVDTNGRNTDAYRVVTFVNGTPTDTSKVTTPWNNVYHIINLDQPANGAQGGTYSPNDMSVGDVDGDGEYELFLKWDPSTSKDNSQSDKTDNVFIDCYKLDGTKLWRINLGVNIRAGAHYTQFLVYDFDGDGKAELMCKTAPGSKDGKGNYVNLAATDNKIKSADNTKDHRTSAGRINGGQEYLTVFNGETGAAIHTIAYYPNRNAKEELSEAEGTFNWDDRSGKSDKGNYGNRGERYLATVAYLDGPQQNPSGVFCRGYYTYAYLWAVEFDGQQLKPKWLHRSDSKTSYSVVTYNQNGEGTKTTFSGLKPTSGSGSSTMYGNGNHNLSTADVDSDGCDEIIWGSAACDNDGKLLYATGFGHGDAIHLSDLNPSRPGLEVFQVHEEKGTYAWDVHDAWTGEILIKGGPEGVDNGRGIAAQLSNQEYGFFFSSASAREQRSATTGEIVSEKNTSLNFRIYWDGDLQDELLDGNTIDTWNGNGTSRLFTIYNSGGPSSTCNSTKNTPNLQADILGDWREEVILHNGSNQLAIYSTNIVSDFMIPTLMHDHTYRMGITWQNTAYNQPPHLGYYLPDFVKPRLQLLEGSAPFSQEVALGDSMTVFTAKWKNCSSAPSLVSIAPDGTKKSLNMNLPGFTNSFDKTNKVFTLRGEPQQMGEYQFILKLKNTSETVEDTIYVHVLEPTNIIQIGTTYPTDEHYYNLQGQRIEKPQHGIYIFRGRKYIAK